MEYKSVDEMAKLWSLSERSVRNYCAQGRIEGARLAGKTWQIPIDALKPSRKPKTSNLLSVLKEEKARNLKGGIYHKTQVLLAYNSNHIEGSKLSEEQTRYIYETNTIGISDKAVNIDDINETINHFKCFDYVIDNANVQLNEKMIKTLHKMLKNNTSDANKTWFAVGEYKKLPNEIGGKETCLPEQVETEMKKLLDRYNKKIKKNLEDIVEFHKLFEAIHPFQDGNGRVGRLIMFKECLKYDIVPFIITDDLKYYYYRGLNEWDNEKGFLIDTCKFAQDQYKKYLDYFRISYQA